MSDPNRRTVRRLAGLAVVCVFVALSAASGPGEQVEGGGGFYEGFAEGATDAFERAPFNPTFCDSCEPETIVSNPDPGEGEGEGEACGSYSGPTADPQRDAQCQAAWSAQCNGQDSSDYCGVYNSSSWGSPGSCPYC